VIVEILDRRGAVRHRARLTAFPATIGRGYGNDVILDDRYVDPLHAWLEWDGNGGLVLVDQGSVNLLRDPVSGQRTRQLPVRSGLEVRLGRTTLRFMNPATALEAALRDGAVREGAGGMANPLVMAGIILGTGALLTLNTWLGKTDRTRLSELAGEVLIALLMVMVWAGGWALVNRITQQRFRFPEHLTIPCVVLSGFIVANGVEEWLAFLVPEGIAWGTLIAGIGLGLTVWGLAAHLARVSSLSRAALWLWSLAVVGALTGVVMLANSGDRPEFAGASSDSQLKPLPASWIPAATPAEFLTEVDQLKETVDEVNDRMAERDAEAE
jgi:hypothetical protein